MAIGVEARRNRRFGAKKKQELKKTLGVQGQKNNVVAGIGQNIQQDNTLLSNKATEQQLIKPAGARRRGRSRPGSTLGVPEILPFNDPASKLTPNERFRIGTPPTDTTPKKIAKGQGPLEKLNPPRKITSSEIGSPGGQIGGKTVRNKGARRRRPQGGGLNFDLLDFKGLDNIFSSAGNLAAFFASPAFQAQQFKARGAKARQRGITAQTKATNERIKALSSALDNIPDIEGNQDVRSLLTTQITDLITNGSKQDDPVLKFAELAKNKGFERGEIESLAQRLFGENK